MQSQESGDKRAPGQQGRTRCVEDTRRWREVPLTPDCQARACALRSRAHCGPIFDALSLEMELDPFADLFPKALTIKGSVNVRTSDCKAREPRHMGRPVLPSLVHASHVPYAVNIDD